jgi:hypothetical protein
MKKRDYSGLYMELTKKDVISRMRHLVDSGAYWLRDDGKLDRQKRLRPAGPWIFVKHAANRRCYLWHQVYFDVFGIIPSYCMECWKVVIRPKTVRQLLDLYHTLRELDIPSKCGIEQRMTVFGHYGGYCYNDSKEQGLECLDKVRQAVAENVGVDVPVFLKRACTEFELARGPSDEWKMSREDLDVQSLLDDVIVQDVVMHTQPEHLRAHIMREWLHFAYANADESVKEICGGPLFPAYVTYEREGGPDFRY